MSALIKMLMLMAQADSGNALTYNGEILTYNGNTIIYNGN